ncbi:Ferrous-iron efflux pump FieF [Methyloligella halotolerans]|uniref:Protein p34 n=1 Tax=Methyloligella halotolerans TaxID=1177755 RepID=A0A1E2RZ89_9HYPH|nr:cation diffusion facilitator family transporter [Methyloligella halotolerans]ODA67369.1 Ferrous-iron efflux pump FieF [Methyloligella halotolerans]
MLSATKLALGSIAVSLLVLGLKYWAYVLTGSVGLYSDALESIVNVATAITSYMAVRLSAKPPDANHPYGHDKAEYLSAVLVGVLIVLAALSILHEAYYDLQNPKLLSAPLQGLSVNGLATLFNAAWCFMLIRFGRSMRSTALESDGKHLMTDVVTSVGVLLGVAAAMATGWAILDPAVAVLVALNILWMGWDVMRKSIGGLMDEAVPEEDMDRIRETISSNAEGAIEAHDVRTRRAGRMTFIDFHLVVPGEMSVEESHDICDRIEDALKRAVKGAKVTIHVEPEAKAKHPGGVPVV